VVLTAPFEVHDANGFRTFKAGPRSLPKALAAEARAAAWSPPQARVSAMPLRVVTPPAEDAALITLDGGEGAAGGGPRPQGPGHPGLIDAALDAIETDVQRRYFAQTLEWVCDTWPAGKPFPIAA
jgi:hypothetical protein